MNRLDEQAEWELHGNGKKARSADDRAAQHKEAGPTLPPHPDELLALPAGLGDLQAWIYGYMTYPDLATAAFTSISVAAHFAMAGGRIDSRRGLGFNEQFMLLAPTGFGKEDMRAPYETLDSALREMARPAGASSAWLAMLPRIQHSAPASQQGFHRILETHPAQSFLADEFAEWLERTGSDSHRQQAMGHLMQAYSRAFSTLAAPAAVTTEYKPVTHPRVQVFATSTAERILETVTASQGDSGALNRFVIMTGEQGPIRKRYGVKAANFKPPEELVRLVAWVVAKGEFTIVFDASALALYEKHDAAVLDPLKFRDPRLAGRLNEQAFKIAGLLALFDKREAITADDLRIAYAIREGLYHRTASLIGYDGALSGLHPTGRALEQLRAQFEARRFIYRSDLPKVSRRFGKLSVHDREAVVRELLREDIADLDGARLVSRICREEAP